MESFNYNNLLNYLTNKQIPIEFSDQQKQQLIKQSKHFTVKNNLLYKIDKRKENNILKVIQKNEISALMYMMHNDPTSGHFATDIMFEKVKCRYYWPQMYDDIKKYVKSCDSCQRRGRPQKHTKLHPIPVQGPFYQIGIDIVGPLNRTARGKKYIVVAIDYLTKWPEARAISEATAAQVANFIYEQIICQHGCPQKILSDRGTHLNLKSIIYYLHHIILKQMD